MNDSERLENSASSKGIIVAIVVILLLGGGYFFYNRFHTAKSAPNPTLEAMNTQDIAPMPSPTDASPSAKPGEQMTVSLLEQNKSKQAGIATITELGDKVSVKIQLAGATGSAEPAHIHTGKCPKPGAVKYPLTDVVNGLSETMVDVSFSTLKSMLPLAINVHQSKEQIQKYVACGDLY